MMMGVSGVWGDEYTFYVINNNGKESVLAKATVETPSTVLDAFKATSVVSPFIVDNNYYFYDTEADAIAATGLTNGGGNGSSTVATIDDGGDKKIYVRYYYDASLSPTPIDLSGSVQYNIMIGGLYFADNVSRYRPETRATGDVTEEALLSDGHTNNYHYLWKLTGNDPYNIALTSTYTPGDRFLWGEWGNSGSTKNMYINNGVDVNVVGSGNATLGTTILTTNLHQGSKGNNLASFILLPHSSGTGYVLMAATTSNQPNGSNQYAYQSTKNNNNQYTNPWVRFASAASAEAVSFTPRTKCEPPTVTYDNSTGYVTIESATTGAAIYYTVDGSTEPSSSTTPYTAPFNISAATTIKAIAIKADRNNSNVSTKTISKLSTPTIIVNGSSIIITADNETTIHYTTDGNPPTMGSSVYSTALSVADYLGETIQAIAVKAGSITSDIASQTVTLTCAQPVISVDKQNKKFSITCSEPTSGVTIYYTTDDSDPSTSTTREAYSVPVDFDDYGFTVKAIAVADGGGYSPSVVAEKYIQEMLNGSGTAGDPYLITSSYDYGLFVNMVNQDGAGACYLVTNDNITASGIITATFTGIFDGGLHTISGLSNPLFPIVYNGTVKNVILKSVEIEQEGPVGAIASVAMGYSRIYNCGILPTSNQYAAANEDSHVKSTNGDNSYCGGIVGWLKDDSRVINCFSYANITGGTDVAGIVGHNEIASTTEVTDNKYANLRTAVVNCMFYGNITSGSNRYPVYGGAKIVNNTATGINNYDFYRADASLGTLADYNCSWPAKEDYLTKYEFYRNLLNSNRELCGWWVGAPSAPSTMSTADVQAVPKDATLMAKWVLDTDIAPYPILKKFGKYTSPVNIDANASWRETANEWEGKKLGTLKVTINPGTYPNNSSPGVSAQSDVDFIITDMDTLRADYCYKKIQLPYYNTVFGNPSVKIDAETAEGRATQWASKYGGNYGDYVVVGWKVSTTEGTTGTFVSTGDKAWQDGYNFADRNCTAKDANRVFAQGGYYYVPNGVENITITAQWASAIYLDNTGRYYDRVSVSDYNTESGVSIGSSTLHPFAPAGIRPNTLDNGKTVQDGSISSKIPSNGSVYGNAVVLVGNHQYFTGSNHVKGSNNSYGCTIMSADFNCDDEPDYCLEWQLGTKTNRYQICPIRFDFLPVAELGLAMKEDGSTQYYSLGCYHPLGHFEVTETALIHFGQFEFSSERSASPIILNGGIFDQYTKGTTGGQNADKDKMTYVILGGNVRMPSFTPGSHVNSSYTYSTRHCAVNVLGGNIDCLYLTGNYNESVKPNQDDPHCYIDGGRFKLVAAAGKEGINGDVYFKINHSKIWEFYGGSTMDQSTGDTYKIVKGNIDITIDNSIVDKYCGGPKFGDMIYDENNFANGKTITTNATNTIFGVYYGGGNGGTSYVQYDNYDKEQNVGFSLNLSGYTPGSYRNGNGNYMADYDMEIVNTSAGTNQNRAIYRTYFFAAQFSATNTGSITNNLTDCKVLTNFYGAGNLGGVKGNVTSTLTDTKVLGSAFGAGFSATVPNVIIHNKDKNSPTINANTGIITPQSHGTGTTYTWCYKNTTTGVIVPSGVVIPNNVSTGSPNFEYNNKKYYYTEVSLENLGAVSGTVTLTITGSDEKGSVIGTEGDDTTGNVYGGGDASAVINTTTPATASTIVNISGKTLVRGNVFGGGNKGEVSGSATVNIQQPTQ